MKSVILVLIVAVVYFAVRWMARVFPRGRALRPVLNPNASNAALPSQGSINSVRWYVESTVKFGGQPYSCSFVEFDERGDYLDFHQHRRAYQKIEELTAAPEPLVLVIFVHGWRNNCQSGNVTSFNYFLSQLASSPRLTGQGCRVHGVYIAWRGAIFGHDLDENDPHYAETTGHFGGDPLVDLENYTSRVKWVANLAETFGYWDRKSIPEHKFSGTSLSRTIFTCAHSAKRVADSSVFLMGHSFGGLMLERTAQNAAIGELTSAWPWNPRNVLPNANPLPFDLVLFVNSASPSIYAKQFQSYLAAHRSAMRRQNVRGADAPIFVSMTSEADWATGKVHPLGNCMAPFSPTLQRDYRADDFILDVPLGTAEPWIAQANYYVHTPGHNPLLVNRFIEPLHEGHIVSGGGVRWLAAEITGTGERNILHENLAAARFIADPAQGTMSARFGSPQSPFVFYTSAPKRGGTPNVWAINMPPAEHANRSWSRYEAYRPVAWNAANRESAYWIVRCPREIISGHNDIWNKRAMETYAALYRIAEELRK